MTNRLPVLPVVVLLGWAALGRPAGGESLVGEAARQLLLQPSLEAKIRQRVNLFGQRLVGAGVYRQLMDGQELRLKLELKLQTAGQITSVQQISDGRFLYIRRDWPGRETLSRIDLQRVRKALSESPDRPPNGALPGLELGGLPKLLQSLENDFQFSDPRPETIGPLPVWVLEGRWKTEKLVRLLPDQRADILAGKPPRLAELPAHLPNSVVVVLGRDQSIPLFPYRIAYRRQSPANGAAGDEVGGGKPESSGAPRSIVTIELFEVRSRIALDPLQFNYQAGEQEVVNCTDLVLRRLGAAE